MALDNSTHTQSSPKRLTHKPKINGIPENCLLVAYYTDPLCCWSWASQNTLDRLSAEYKDRIEIRYVLSVLFPVTAPVKKPLEMAAEWSYAARHTGTPNDASIWNSDAPTSSYQACLAVKTAALQSPEAERLCLYKMREAVMTRRLNISKNSVIIRLAEELAIEHPDDFKVLRFARDFSEEKARVRLDKDIYKRTYHGIEQLPTFQFTTAQGKKMILTGFKHYDLVRNSLRLLGF